MKEKHLCTAARAHIHALIHLSVVQYKMLSSTIRKLPSVFGASRLLRIATATQRCTIDTCNKQFSGLSCQADRGLIIRSRIAQQPLRLYSKKANLQEKESGEQQNVENDDEQSGLRFKLTDLEPICWGGLLKLMRKIFETFFYRKWFDPDWNEEYFLKGAAQAVSVVSDAISRGDFAALDGLVAEETIKEVRENYERLSEEERQFIKVHPEDFIFSIVYQFGFVKGDAGENFVDVHVVLHGYDGAAEMLRSVDTSNLVQRAQAVDEATRTREDSYYVLNYCFRKKIRLQTLDKRSKKDDSDEQWTVSALNHFKLSEYKKFYMWRR